MGKALILNNIGDGKYKARIMLDVARATATCARLSTAIALLDNTIIPQLQAQEASLSLALQNALVYLEDMIQKYNANEVTRDDVVQATSTYNQADKNYTKIKSNLSATQMKRTAMATRKAWIESQMRPDYDVFIWCADHTIDLPIGLEVGTIEIPNEAQHEIIIRPGFAGDRYLDTYIDRHPGHLDERDGQLQQLISSTPASAFYNASMFPGWGKWMPTYRIGTITDITRVDIREPPTPPNVLVGINWFCDLTFDDAFSGAQGLNINENSQLEDVLIEYMELNGHCFAVDDRVVVGYEDQQKNEPRVIGFENNPWPDPIFYFRITRGDGTLITPSTGGASFFIYDYDQGWPWNVGQNIHDEYDNDPASDTYQYWKVWLNRGETPCRNGYFAEYGCVDGIETQYPYRYKDADQRNPADLIQPGTYEATIPYWTYSEYPMSTAPFDPSETRYDKLTVKSSVPYRVRFRVNPVDMSGSPSPGRWLKAVHTAPFGVTGDCCDSGGSPTDLSDWVLSMIASARVWGYTIDQTGTGLTSSITLETVYQYSGATISGASYYMYMQNLTPLNRDITCNGLPPPSSCDLDGIYNIPQKHMDFADVSGVANPAYQW